MKFLCLAFEEERIFHEMPADEWSRLRDETLAYVELLRERGQLLDARPLQSATRSAMVRVRDGKVTVSDGPFAETKEQLGGYFLIEVEDAEEARRIAAGWPSARLGSIEVRPVEEGLDPDARY